MHHFLKPHIFVGVFLINFISAQEIPQDFEGLVNSHEISTSSVKDLQCVEDSLKGNDGQILSELEICKGVSLECLYASLQKLLEDPTKQVSGKDFACILLNLLQRNTEYAKTVSKLESSLKSNQEEIKTLTHSVDSHFEKFIPIEKLAQLEVLEKNVATFESNASQRVEKLEEQISTLSKTVEKAEKTDDQLKKLIHDNQKTVQEMVSNLNSTLKTVESQANSFDRALIDLSQIGVMWSEIASNVHRLEIRTTQNEQEIGNFTKIHENFDILTNLSNQVYNVKNELSTTLPQFSSLQEDYKNIHSSFSNLNSDFLSHKAEIKLELENATNSIKEMLQLPLKNMDQIGFELGSKLSIEASRAQKAESILAETLIKHTSSQMEVKSLIQAEITRATQIESKISSTLSDTQSKIGILREDLTTQIKMESLRAKGTEAQLSSIIGKEVEKLTKKSVGEFAVKLDKLGQIIIEESKRAMSVEEELENKIYEESSRAKLTESGLLDNINQELKRASEQEQELKVVVIENSEKISDAQENLLKLKESLDKEIESCSQVVININTNVNQQLTEMKEHHEGKIIGLEKTMNVRVDQEQERAESVETDILLKLHSLINQSTLLEAQNIELVQDFRNNSNIFIELKNNQSILEQELTGVKTDHDSKFNNIESKLDSFSILVSDQVEKSILLTSEIEKNFTIHLLTLADEMDKKLDTFTYQVYEKFEKVELDLTELNTTLSKSLKPIPPTSGVLNRIVGFFNSRRPSNVTSSATRKKAGKILKKKTQVEIDEDDEADADMVKELTTRLRVDDVFNVDIDESEADLLKELSSSEDGRKRVNSGKGINSRKNIPIVVQRSNSRIRNMYG